ncbi:MAG: hypothetical protein ACOYJI_05730 [Anaerovoracaceae bacterium]|jgi:hypothetical protein
MKRGRLLGRILVIFTSSMLLLLLMSAGTVMAQEGNDNMPDLEGNRATLTITCQYDDNGVVTKVKDVELELTKIADVSVDDGNVSYTLLPEFKDCGIEFTTDMTASESNQAAKELLEIKEEKGIIGPTAVTNSEGVANFYDLAYGMYLITQNSTDETSEDSASIEPYLVMVPNPDPVELTWEYDVESEPKLVSSMSTDEPETPDTETPDTETPDTETPVTPEGSTDTPDNSTTITSTPTNNSTTVSSEPKTGDFTDPRFWAGAMLASSAIILAILYRKKRAK